MAGNDVFLRDTSVQAGADVRLYDPTTSGAAAYTGTVDGAASGTAAGDVVGAQTYVGLVAGAASATTASEPTGTQAHEGAISTAVTATAADEVLGEISGIQPAVDGADSATAVDSVTGSYVVPVISTGGGGGGWGGLYAYPRRKVKSRADDELDRWLRGPVRKAAPTLDASIARRVSELKEEIAAEKRAQQIAQERIAEAIAQSVALRSQVALSKAIEARRAAEVEYARAVQAETDARRRIKDLDIAFVSAVLMEM